MEKSGIDVDKGLTFFESLRSRLLKFSLRMFEKILRTFNGSENLLNLEIYQVNESFRTLL